MEINELTTAKAIVEALPDAIIIADDQGNHIDMNSKACILTGYAKEELLEMNICDLMVSEKFNCKSLDTTKKTDAGQINEKLRTKDGTSVHAEVTTTRLSDNITLWILRDMTAKRKAAAEIFKPDERFNLISKATKDGIYDWDLKKNTLSGNENFMDYFGPEVSKGELSIEAWIQCIHPDERERIKTKVHGAIKNGEEYRQDEYRYLLHDGSYAVFYDRAYILKSNEGEPIRMIGVMTDVTKMKKAEQALHLSEEKFAKAFHNNVAGMAIWDEQGKFVDVNYAFEKMVEYTRNEMIGKTSTELRLVTEDVRIDLINEVRKKGSIANFEISLTTKTGRAVTALAYLSNIEVDGQVQRLNTFVDITEKKRVAEKLEQSEIQYRLLFNATPLPAWVVDNETQNYLEVNEAAINHYGFSREEFLNMNSRLLRPESELERFNARVADPAISFVGKQGIWKHRKKDGSIIDVEAVSHEIMYERKPARLVLANDITEKLQLEREMKLMNEELRNLSMHLQEVREKERIHIAREIHDELGQQLTGLKMYVHSLNKKLVTEDENIKKKLIDILQLVNETINSVRKIATNLRPSMLDDLGLVAAMEWLSQEVEKRSEIKIDLVCRVPAIEIDDCIKTGIFRIYQETLTNIVRHADADRVESKLQLENNHLILEVKDDGRGFSPGKSGRNNTFGLLGIKERSNMLGGTYELVSEPGNGTTILISIPVK